MQQLSKAYRNKKVFLTGHTGFKGSWMSVWLSELGAEVKGYALKAETLSLYNLVKKNLKNHESVIADIRNRERLEKEILNFKPDFIFHLAAQPLVLESYRTPLETFAVNVMGTANLLEALRKLDKKCAVVIVTTDKVYRNHESGKPFKETDALGGYDPYSASKAAAEIVTESYRSSFFNTAKYKLHRKSIASARAGNVIGGGDFATNRIVPDIYRALSKGDTIVVRNPNAIRPWQHVLDPLNGYLLLGSKLNSDPVLYGDAFNFGPDIRDSISVESLVKKAIANWGTGTYRAMHNKNAEHEASLLRLNIQKAQSLLHLTPHWNSSEAIEETIAWYKIFADQPKKAFSLCMNNINAFNHTGK